MARPINYSKWDHIEISDDEDDTHPNVDTASLFRWRHQARIEREEKEKQEKAKRNAEIKIAEQKVHELKRKKDELAREASASVGTDAQLKGVDMELSEVERQHQEFLAKEAELERQEKLFPKWNVDNISKPKTDRTLVNKPKALEPKTEEESMKDMNEFFKTNGKRAEKFGMLSKYSESHKYLKENMDLVCEHFGSYLIIWAIDLQVEGKTALVERVAHQCICVNYIMELAKSMKKDPRACVDAFFARIEVAEKEYKDAFDQEYKSLLQRIAERAVIRLQDAEREAKEQEEKDRQARLGPNGLDPLEVLKELPAKMREAFETQNTPLLKEAFAELGEEESRVVWEKVVGSGLWVPAKPDAGGDEAGGDDGDDADVDE